MSSEMGHEDEKEKFEKNESIADSTDANIKSEEKEDLKERYNKLRGFAVKLKEKVKDLTEEVKNLENDKQKAVAEKDELQNKISQISDNAKKLQTIQAEYDNIQDSLETEKLNNKKILKNLETVVVENALLKESLYDAKENIARCKNELERRAKEITNLEAGLKTQQALVKKLSDEKKAETLIREQKEKDYLEILAKLDFEIQLHKATQAHLESAKQERTTNSVLSLEVDNYERSVEDLKAKLEDEASRSEQLEQTIKQKNRAIEELESDVKDLRENCLAKSNQVTNLSDKNEAMKAELCELRREIEQSSKEIQSLAEGLEAAMRENAKLAKDLEISEAEKIRTIEDTKIQTRQHVQQKKVFETECARLNNLVSTVNQELDSLRNEYDGYKLRAQSVLRTKQTQGKESGSGGRNLAEIEEELEHTRTHGEQLNEKLSSCRENLKAVTKELNVTKEDRDRTLENSRDLAEKLALLGQDYTTLRDQYRTQTSLMEKQRTELTTKIETLQKLHENQIAELEVKNRKEISRLEFELQTLAMSSAILENHHQTNAQSEKSHETRYEQENQSRDPEMLYQEREDAEGSESVDSYPTGLTHQEMSRRHSLVPLDELLNSSDDYTKVRQAPALPRKVDRQELELCERRVKHLTVLLADTERDVAKLTQLNQLLKEDIRRQQRSVEREHHANNFEYMKNVIFKFVTLKNGDERNHLIPVLNTILKLSPEETQQLNQVAGVGRGWLPGIPIPGWHNN